MSSKLACVVLFFATFTRALVFDAQLCRNVLQSAPVTGLPPRHPTSALRSLRTEQTTGNTCAWDDLTGSCFFSGLAVFDFLEEADNKVANFLQRSLTCRLAEDGKSCAELACEWNGRICEVPHEVFREFASADCLADIEHLIEEEAGYLECMPASSQTECQNMERCTWAEDYGFCVFDKFLYHHGIPSSDAKPETFTEVYQERGRQLIEEMNAAVKNESISYLSDILDWEPTPFECSTNFTQVVCDYAEAYTEFQKTNIYCSHGYMDVTHLRGCFEDPLCTPTGSTTAPCAASNAVALNAYLEAHKSIANSIKDPETRKYELQSIECLGTFNQEACKDACTWMTFPGVCVLSLQWVAEEVYNVVGDSDDPVCKFFVSDAKSGCIEIENGQECVDDRGCFWIENTDSCLSGLYTWLDIAVEDTELRKEFSETKEACFNSQTAAECDGVAHEISDVEEDLAYAVGSEAALTLDESEMDKGMDTVREKRRIRNHPELTKLLRGNELGPLSL